VNWRAQDEDEDEGSKHVPSSAGGSVQKKNIMAMLANPASTMRYLDGWEESGGKKKGERSRTDRWVAGTKGVPWDCVCVELVGRDDCDVDECEEAA